jgi:hypothetical protein
LQEGKCTEEEMLFTSNLMLGGGNKGGIMNKFSNKRESASKRQRVGIIFGPIGKLNVIATTYLILHLNNIQQVIEFEFLPSPEDDPFWKYLQLHVPINRIRAGALASQFKERYKSYWKNEISRTEASERVPENIIVISLVNFLDNYYSITVDGISILALGNWKRYMAPPSLLEFILILTIRLAIGLIDPRMRSWRHLGTKGCLWDFNPYLDDVRQKILLGYVCDECRKNLENGVLAPIVPDLTHILSKTWIGNKNDPQSVASICSKLGYDLFIAKGLQPTFHETMISILQQEGLKEIIKWIFAIILAIVLVWIGLK